MGQPKALERYEIIRDIDADVIVELQVSGHPNGIVTMLTQIGCNGRGDS